MSTPQGELSSATPDVTNSTAVSEGSSSAASSTAPNAVTDSTSSADVNTQSVQDSQPSTTEEDVLAGFPPDAELEAAVAEKIPWAEMAARLKGAYAPLKTQFSELQEQFKVFEPIKDRFTAPEELQSLVDMRESLFGWEQGPNGQLIPATQKFVETLDPARQSYVFADLADAMVTDAQGQSIRRIDQIITRMGQDPTERANIARALGLVEPSAVAPQWAPTSEQLNAIPVDPANPTPKDKELQDIFRSLPYDEREALATNEPDQIRRTLEREQLLRQLTADKEATTRREQEQQSTYREQLQQEAQAAGDAHVTTQLNDALTVFHKSVVDQCRLLEPLDPAAPPEGMDAAQVAQYNQSVDMSNKAEAAQVTLAVVGLINEQTRPYVLPLLKEIGIIDDKFLAQLDAAGKAFGDNARNFGHLTHTQKQGRNGTYQPGPDVTMLSNESSRNLKLLTFYANQVKSKLIEAKSQAFGMRANGHNQILNGAAVTRPSVNGGSYDPTTAATQQLKGWMTRDEIAANIR